METRSHVTRARRRKEARSDDTHVGAMVRDLRLARGKTLAELAKAIGRSIGYVSQIERDQSGISIATLQKIADALGVGINWFFQGPGAAPAGERDVIVRKGNRRILDLSGEGVIEELLSPTLTGQLEMIVTTFQPKASTGRGGRLRKGEEAGLLLSGELNLFVDGKRFKLTAGDSYSLRHKGRHRFENPGSAPAILLCAITPPSSY
ncbi:MAG: helix-turn-helix domain-containing protein [Hyphomicrobiales bacterium]|nr:MAG: helix-turn-helix domain-containing protein [Hyphomicrobiales bacterium]